MVLWGPPGTGKTTLGATYRRARGRAVPGAVGRHGRGEGHSRRGGIGAQEREAHGRPTVLFLDEVHRFNKAQQDTFLPYWKMAR